MRLQVCKDKRQCFAKVKMDGQMRCNALSETYEDGRCPFCKPVKDITNGKRYPYNPDYGHKEVE